MTTLAQIMCETPEPAGATFAERSCFELLRYRLRGAPFAHGRLIQHETGEAVPLDQQIVPKLAERFVFREDAPAVAHALIASGQVSGEVMFQTARYPMDCLWVEWPALTPGEANPLKIGALIDENASAGKAGAPALPGFGGGPMVIFCGADTRRGVGMILFVSTFPQLPCASGDIPAALHWGRGAGVNGDEGQFRTLANELINILFLLTTPRVCELTDISHAAKFQKARTKRGKLPLIEYKEVKLTIGIGGARSRSAAGSSAEADDPHGVRLHSVIGHFRTYREGRDVPKVSWVPGHWRGDPALGIVIKSHEVKK